MARPTRIVQVLLAFPQKNGERLAYFAATESSKKNVACRLGTYSEHGSRQTGRDWLSRLMFGVGAIYEYVTDMLSSWPSPGGVVVAPWQKH